MEKLQRKIGCKFKDEKLLKLALSHSSAADDKTGNYERLEFMGDSILSFVISEYLYGHCKDQEGELSKVRASVVCEQSLAQAATRLGIGDVMLLGKGEEQTGGRTRPSILADMFEAVIAAIYFDSGLETAKKFVLDNLTETIKLALKGEINKDYKTTLQEFAQAEGKTPKYLLTDESGPEHNKLFVSSVSLDNKVVGEGQGRSKKEAEQQAAKMAIDTIYTIAPTPY